MKSAVEPVSDDLFCRSMASLGPFEVHPLVAVAVSGGSDSMALAVLANRWAAACGGKAVALTVDHGLRSEAAGEARQVGRWLAACGMSHHILTNRHPLSVGGLQAAARAVRYDLMERWCMENGCLHLMLAHGQDDQAETFLLRLGRGSGVRGLTAMRPIVWRRGVRLLRPVLSYSRESLRTYLRHHQQPWLDDPSNDSDVFARVRIRKEMKRLAAVGLPSHRLAATTDRLQMAHHLVERHAANVQAEAICIHPGGWGWGLIKPLRDAEQNSLMHVLGGLLTAIGGQSHGPRADRLLRLLNDVVQDAPRLRAGVTLHGCRIKRTLDPSGEDAVLIAREVRLPCIVNVPSDGKEFLWDGRFRIRFWGKDERVQYHIGPLAAQKSSLPPVHDLFLEKMQKSAWKGIPGMARHSLPTLYRGGRLVAIPHVGWMAEGDVQESLQLCNLRFSPARAVGSIGVPPECHF